MSPADVSERPARWLGTCAADGAQGLGVLRLGASEPYAFFVGQMTSGKPSKGLVIETSGSYMTAMGFDVRGNAIIADGDHIPEQDDVWATAVRAADTVADRFTAAGNRKSAACYRRFARKIEYGRPE